MKRWTIRCLLVVAMGLVVVIVCVSQASASILVAEWTFDEGGGDVLHDSSGNGYDGDINGSPTWVPGESGMALHFDGVDDYVEIPGTSHLNFESGFTLKARVRFTEHNSLTLIVGKHVGGVAAGYFLGVSPDDKLDFFMNSVPPLRLKTTTSYKDGEWHDIVGRYDGTNQSLYVDDKFIDQQPISYTNFSDCNITIGRASVASMFIGDIDNVQIFVVPEPSTITLLLCGLASLIWWRRRR